MVIPPDGEWDEYQMLIIFHKGGRGGPSGYGYIRIF